MFNQKTIIGDSKTATTLINLSKGTIPKTKIKTSDSNDIKTELNIK